MKALSRDFTPKELALLLVLGLLLLGLSYYQFFHIPCAAAAERAKMRQEDLQMDLMVAQAREAKLKQMQAEIDSLGELTKTSRMGSYNNSEAELLLLNHALEDAGDYYVSFSTVTRDGDQIRRNFRLQFTAANFEQAKEIVTKLARSEYRCLLSDMQYSAVSVRNQNQNQNKITVSATATFFETMFDGTPDAGLPEDKKAS